MKNSLSATQFLRAVMNMDRITGQEKQTTVNNDFLINEYNLILQKKSKLSAKKRKEILRMFKTIDKQ